MIACVPHDRVDIDIIDLGKRLVRPRVGQTAFDDIRRASVNRIGEAEHPRLVAPIAQPMLPVGLRGVTEVAHRRAEGVGGVLGVLAAFALLLGLLFGHDIDTALAFAMNFRS